MAKAKRMVVKKKTTTRAKPKRQENNKKKGNKIFLIGKIVMVIAIILAVFFVLETKISEEAAKENIKSDKTFENLTIKNIDLKYEEGNSFLRLELINQSDKEFQERDIKIIFQNKDGSEYANIQYHIGTIKSQETFYINTSTNIDLTKASDFYIENK